MNFIYGTKRGRLNGSGENWKANKKLLKLKSLTIFRTLKFFCKNIDLFYGFAFFSVLKIVTRKDHTNSRTFETF